MDPILGWGCLDQAIPNPQWTTSERRETCLKQLVLQGLSSDAAVALVTKVVNDFGLKSISDQSEAFRHLARDSAARAETRMMSKTGKTVKQFKIAYDLERSKALDGQAM